MVEKAMKTAEALSALGVASDTLSVEEKSQLDERGYLYLHNVLTADQLEAIRQRFDEIESSEGDEAGEEMARVKEAGIGRLANLVEKGVEFAPCYTHPRVLAAMAHIMGEEIHFDSLNGRNCPPGEGLQALHRDAMGSTDETG
ncbi:MAG: phytanoyl-CoA dioxygenase family protein, partial [Chloroflexota bacterium]|nr:phytanoyl-CoA dioxygenase family protein [Chloroflexota bacterium]